MKRCLEISAYLMFVLFMLFVHNASCNSLHYQPELSLKFKYIGNRNPLLVVKAEINNSVPQSFIFDTGTNCSLVINSRYASYFKLHPENTTTKVVPSNRIYNWTTIKDFKLGSLFDDPLEYKSFKGITGFVPRNDYMTSHHIKIYGIIGTELFANMIFQINYKTRRINFISENTLRKLIDTSPRISILHMGVFINKSMKTYTIPATVSSNQCNLYLDTGTYGLYMRSTFASKLNILGVYPFHQTIPYKSDCISALISSVQLGKYSFLNISTSIEHMIKANTNNTDFKSILLPNKNKNENEYFQGSVGNSIFSKLNPIFDYKDREFVIQNKISTFRQMIRGYTGIHFIRHADNIDCSAIDPTSPAALAGIKKGEKIIDIDNLPVSFMKDAQIYDKINAEPGTMLTLDVLNHCVKKTVSVQTISRFSLEYPGTIIPHVNGEYIPCGWTKPLQFNNIRNISVPSDGSLLIYNLMKTDNVRKDTVKVYPAGWNQPIVYHHNTVMKSLPNGMLILYWGGK